MKNILKFFIIVLLVNFMGCMKQAIPSTQQKVIQEKQFNKNQTYLVNKIKEFFGENYEYPDAFKNIQELKYNDKIVLLVPVSVKYPCDGVECIAKGNWSILFKMKIVIKQNIVKVFVFNFRLNIPSSYNSTFGYQKGSTVIIRMDDDWQKAKMITSNIINSLFKYIDHN